VCCSACVLVCCSVSTFYFYLPFLECLLIYSHIHILYPSPATHCNTLQHTATHCSTLQHTVAHCDTLQHTQHRRRMEYTYSNVRIFIYYILPLNVHNILHSKYTNIGLFCKMCVWERVCVYVCVRGSVCVCERARVHVFLCLRCLCMGWLRLVGCLKL